MITSRYLKLEIQVLEEEREAARIRRDGLLDTYLTGRIISLEKLIPMADDSQIH